VSHVSLGSSRESIAGAGELSEGQRHRVARREAIVILGPTFYRLQCSLAVMIQLSCGRERLIERCEVEHI